jgi:hypothetical protein
MLYTSQMEIYARKQLLFVFHAVNGITYEADPTKNGPTKATSKDDSGPHVDKPTDDTTNKVVTIADSTSRIYSYTPPQTW